MTALSSWSAGSVSGLTDRTLREESGIVVAFSRRCGGVSGSPYASLNLAGHVGDDPETVDANRAALLDALGLRGLSARLTTAEQVHGLSVSEVGEGECGSGASARPGARPPIAGTDALVTRVTGAPLLMLYADCVPIVLVARGPRRAVAVVHAGWKGALGRLPGKAARRLAETAGCDTAELIAYVGPHIGPCHYEVDAERLSLFADAFGSMAAAGTGLDLGAVVTMSLDEVGVPLTSVVRTGICTAERTDEYYSFRAEGTTGRHGALAVILEPAR